MLVGDLNIGYLEVTCAKTQETPDRLGKYKFLEEVDLKLAVMRRLAKKHEFVRNGGVENKLLRKADLTNK